MNRNTKTVRVCVGASGVNHGYVAQLVTYNGRVMEYTAVYASREGAERAGRDLAERRDWEIA